MDEERSLIFVPIPVSCSSGTAIPVVFLNIMFDR